MRCSVQLLAFLIVSHLGEAFCYAQNASFENVSIAMFGADPVVALDAKVWPVNLDFRENSSSSYHRANIYFSMPRSLLPKSSTKWEFRATVQSVGGRDLEIIVADANQQSLSHRRAIVNLRTGAVMVQSGAGQLNFSNLRAVQLDATTFRIAATVSLDVETRNLRLIFSSVKSFNEVDVTKFAGDFAAGLNIQKIRFKMVPVAPTDLNYAEPDALYTKNSTIVQNIPVVHSGIPTDYTVHPQLPVGLSLNKRTGVISGQPTETQAKSSYIITAANSAGATQRKIFIRIKDMPPSQLRYSAPSVVYAKAMTITKNLPLSTGGKITHYKASPDLPVGLEIDSTTGIISGTPLQSSPAKEYIIIGTNSSGFTQAILSIAVEKTVESSDQIVSTLLSQREGYGRNATGGLGGYYAVVTSDSNQAFPGTLRYAINQAKNRPTWITFDRDMTINFPITSSAIDLPSNITIDGRGHKILIQGPGFTISRGNSNVIITHLSMNGQSCDYTGYCHTDSSIFNPSYSGIRVQGAEQIGVDPTTGLRIWSPKRSRDIWLNHLDISNYPDKLIAISKGGTGVTISYSRLFASKYGLMIGNDFDASVDENGYGSQSAANCNPLSVQAMTNLEGATYVTVHHTIFASLTQRNPRATSNAKVHFYNNVVFSWSVNAVSSQATSQVIAESNLFFNHSYRGCDGIGYPEIAAGMSYTNYCSGVPNSNHNLFQNAYSTNFYPTNGYAQWCPYGEVPGSLYGYIQALDNAFVLDGSMGFVQDRYPEEASPGYPSNLFLGFESELRGHINYPTESLQSGQDFLNQAREGINEVYETGSYNVYPVMYGTNHQLSFPKPVANLLPKAGNL